MSRTVWILIDVVLAALVGVLGNIVASYLQETLNLTDSGRFVIVAVLFVVVLALLLFVTLKRSSAEEGRDSAQRGSAQLRTHQEVNEQRGQLTGIEVEKMSGGNAHAKQKVKKAAEGSKTTGISIGELGGGKVDVEQNIDEVGKGSSVTGARIDRL